MITTQRTMPAAAILVVDDVLENIEMLSQRLIARGYTKLSAEQQKAFEYIKDCIDEGEPPSIRAIAAELGLSSSR